MSKVPDTFQAHVYGSTAYKERDRHVMPFPMIIDVEPTNACNLDCLFCARQVMTRPLKILPLELVHKLVDEVAEHRDISSIRFSGWGEPTLHPDIAEMVQLCGERDILTHLTTNAVKLDDRLSLELLEAGLNKIKFSLQGLTDAEYERMRRDKGAGGGYDTVVSHIERFVALRNELGVPCHVQVSVSMLKREQDDQAAQQAFYDRWFPLVDSIWGLGKVGIYGGKPLLTSFQRIKDLDTVAVEDISSGRPTRGTDVNRGQQCAEVYTKVSVGADGALKACCDDVDNQLVIGSLGRNSIADVWGGEALNELRASLKSGDPARVPDFCQNCDNYM